jgi:predicted anti-sigma-YlaC factor YlaD
MALCFGSGCSMRHYAINAFADALAETGGVYAADDDIELIGAATPFGLKTIEALLESTPEHRGLLLAAASGFTQYAYVFVDMPAAELEERDVAAAYAQHARARRLYLRARNYGLRGLEVAHPGLTSRLQTDPDAAVAGAAVDDVPLLYWTGLSWAGAISLSKDDPDLVADLPSVTALIDRALELDESFDHGAIHVFLIGYAMSRRGLEDDAVLRARRHFERAVELADGRQAAPYVAFAEAVCVAEQNREEYEMLLGQALALDTEVRPEWRLANLVMQRRARWLLAKTDEYFLE